MFLLFVLGYREAPPKHTPVKPPAFGRWHKIEFFVTKYLAPNFVTTLIGTPWTFSRRVARD